MTAAAAVDLQISIVNHDDVSVVQGCLAALDAACGELQWRATLILNRPAPGVGDRIGRLDQRVELTTNVEPAGFGANHNQVIRKVLHDGSSEFVLILNDDVRPRPGSIAALVARLRERPALAAAVPRIVDSEGRELPNRISYPTLRSALRFDLTGRTEPPDPEGGWLQGACLMLRVEALRQVGAFDERFELFYEDTDLSRRLRTGGWLVGGHPEATVVHIGHATVLRPDLAARSLLIGRRSRYLYFEKHHGRMAAVTLAVTSRTLLAAAGTAQLVAGSTRRSPDQQARGRRLVALARHNPARPLDQPD